RGPDFFRGKSERATEAVVVFAPLRDLAVEELLERGRRPSSSVNAVGDGFNGNFRKHLARSDAVLFRDAVDVGAEAEREVSHIQMRALGCGFLQIGIVRLGL